MSHERIAAVVGANGSIGSELVRNLQERNIPIRAIVREGRGEDLTNIDNVTVHESDLDEIEKLEAAFEGVSEIYHTPALFWQGPPVGTKYEQARTVNVQGLQNVISAAESQNVPWISVLSTVAVYGAQKGEIDESSPTTGKTTYAVTKLEAEEVARNADIGHTNFRLGWVFGPEADIWSRFMYEKTRKLGGRGVIFSGNGSGMLPIIDVRDVADTMVVAATEEKTRGELYNVVGGNMSQREIADYYAVLLKRNPTFIPRGIALLGGKIMDAFTNKTGKMFPYAGDEQVSEENVRRVTEPDVIVSGEKAQRDLGLNFREPHDVMSDTLRYLNEYYELDMEEDVKNFIEGKR